MERSRQSLDLRGRMRDYSQPPIRRSVATRRYAGHDFRQNGRRPALAAPQQIAPKVVAKQQPIRPRPRVVPAPRPSIAGAAPQKIAKKYPAKPRQAKSSVLKRYALRMPKLSANLTESYKKTKKQKHKLRSIAISAMAAIVFSSGMYASLHTWQTNRAVVAEVQGTSSSTPVIGAADDGEVPDETEVTGDMLARYVVAPSLPRYITIEKLGVKARVLRMGLTKSGALAAPKNIYDAGWYEGSVKPGESKGAALIDGHVLGPTKSAVFSKLSNLEDGDVIDIERGDGLHVRYEVRGRDVYARNQTDMAKAMRPFDTRKPGLNIITCHGKYSQDDKTYDERLVVYAVAI